MNPHRTMTYCDSPS